MKYLFFLLLIPALVSADPDFQIVEERVPENVRVGDTLLLRLEFRWESGETKQLLLSEGVSQVRGLQFIKRKMKSSALKESGNLIQKQSMEFTYLAEKEGDVDWSRMTFFQLNPEGKKKVEYAMKPLRVLPPRPESSFSLFWIGGVFAIVVLSLAIFRKKSQKPVLSERVDLEEKLDSLQGQINRENPEKWVLAWEEFLVLCARENGFDSWESFLEKVPESDQEQRKLWKSWIEEAKYGNVLKSYQMREVVQMMKKMNLTKRGEK